MTFTAVSAKPVVTNKTTDIIIDMDEAADNGTATTTAEATTPTKTVTTTTVEYQHHPCFIRYIHPVCIARRVIFGTWHRRGDKVVTTITKEEVPVAVSAQG